MHDEPNTPDEADPDVDDAPASDTSAPAPIAEEGAGDGKGWKIAAGIAVVLALVALGALGSLLFGGGAGGDEAAGDVRACIPNRDFREEAKDEDGPTCPPPGARKLDGLVQKTDGGGFSIQVIDGGEIGKTVKLHVRKPDRAYIDIAHAQTHAALGQPIRVYIEEIDGRDAVIYMEDAPLLR